MKIAIPVNKTAKDVRIIVNKSTELILFVTEKPFEKINIISVIKIIILTILRIKFDMDITLLMFSDKFFIFKYLHN